MRLAISLVPAAWSKVPDCTVSCVSKQQPTLIPALFRSQNLSCNVSSKASISSEGPVARTKFSGKKCV